MFLERESLPELEAQVSKLSRVVERRQALFDLWLENPDRFTQNPELALRRARRHQSLELTVIDGVNRLTQIQQRIGELTGPMVEQAEVYSQEVSLRRSELEEMRMFNSEGRLPDVALGVWERKFEDLFNRPNEDSNLKRGLEILEVRKQAEKSITPDESGGPEPIQPQVGVPTENGHDNERIWSVIFPNGNIVEVSDEIDAKVLRRLVEAIGTIQDSIDIPQGWIVTGVFGRFDTELANGTRKRLEANYQKIDSAGYEIDRIDRQRWDEHNPTLRHIYRVTVKTDIQPALPTGPTSPVAPTPDSRIRRNEDEALSESEKVLKALDILLEDENAEVSRIVELARERLERNLGDKGVNVLNAVSYMVKELGDIYDKLETDRIFQPELVLWEKIRQLSGQSTNLDARRFAEQRISDWYNRQGRKPIGASPTPPADEQKPAKARRIFASRVFTLSNGKEYSTSGGVQIRATEVLIEHEEEELTFEQIRELMREGQDRDYNLTTVMSAVSILKHDPALADASHEVIYVRPEGQTRSKDTTKVVFKRLLEPTDPSQVGAPAGGQPDRRGESGSKQELEAEMREIIGQYDLLHRPEMIRLGAVSGIVPGLNANLGKMIENRYIQPGRTSGRRRNNDPVLTPKQIAQAVIFDRRMRSGGVRGDFARDLRAVTDSAFAKEMRAQASRKA